MKKGLALNGGPPVRKEFLIFGSPHFEEDEINEVVQTIRSCWVGMGPKVALFEREFSRYIGSRYAVALNSCTAGLHLSLLVANIKPGSEVITTPMTFCATANSIIHTGCIPVFADIDKKTINIDPDEIERKITSRTKALIIVHFAGRPCHMNRIIELCRKYNLLLISDCAHAIESEYEGKKVGTYGDMSVFSFYVTKNLVTVEGGMVTTDNEEYANVIKIYGLHGLSKDAWKRYSDEGYKHYYVMYPGYKYNMTDIQASFGIHQLRRLESQYKRRHEIWIRYNEAFKDLPVITPAPFEEGSRHALHLYTLLLKLEALKVDRDTILEALTKENIGVGVHFISLHLHPYYQKRFGCKRGDFPNSEFVSDRTLSIPLSSKLSDKDVDDVIEAVTKVLMYYKK
jgi:dTDP-4-amino-4,6-dideoxygalactose transaminase